MQKRGLQGPEAPSPCLQGDTNETSDCESSMLARIGLVDMLSLEHPNRIDFYFVAGLVAIVAVSVFWLMRRK
jgi:hypothetical protein